MTKVIDNKIEFDATTTKEAEVLATAIVEKK